MSWCITVNFNDIMFALENYGGRSHLRSLLDRFTDVVNKCELIDQGLVEY